MATLPVLGKNDKEEGKPKYRSSVQAPKEDEKAEQLQKLSRISQQEAVQQATAKAGSAKMLKAKLEKEDGNVV